MLLPSNVRCVGAEVTNFFANRINIPKIASDQKTKDRARNPCDTQCKIAPVVGATHTQAALFGGSAFAGGFLIGTGYFARTSSTRRSHQAMNASPGSDALTENSAHRP
jgi:hypothetical protein